ncbi:MAG: hypothetical protein E7656_02220 [Ruminococcaceae bacterium]|nr:hypothetical protein [Oscillospiraceae bacterium]
MAGYSYYKKKQTKSSDNENLSELKARIKEKSPAGIYLFRGEEEYMKRFYFSELCKSSGDSDSNVNVIDAEDFSYERLLDAVNTAPAIDYSDSFFADEVDFSGPPAIRVIKADGVPIDKMNDKEKSDLARLCEYFPSGVCLVFYYSHNPKKESEYAKSVKVLSKCENVLEIQFDHESPTSPSLKKWVKRHFDAKKIVIDAASVDYFIEAVGNDMCTLISEIEKLCAYALCRELPTVYNEDIDFVCIRNTQARLDDVSKGIFDGDYGRAMAALSVLKAEKESEIYIFGAISNKASELYTVDYYKSLGMNIAEISAKTGIRDFVVKNDFRILSNLYARTKNGAPNPCERIVRIISSYDEKMKSSAVNKYLLLENMIFRLCR